MQELAALGAHTLRETVAGVYAEGGPDFVYRVCLWSRFANRVLLPLSRAEVNSADDLYQAVLGIPWQLHFSGANTLAVDFAGKSDAIRHTQFGAQKIKDAIVDHFLALGDMRPNVDLRNPDIRINAYLAKGRVAISLDLSGESLHRRGYRVAMVPAPLKENLAAALLARADWPGIAAAGGALIDPMCGSGTLLIEGAMMAADIAPGLLRDRFGFHRWKQFDSRCWQALLAEADERREAGLARELPEIRGYDKDTRAVDACQQNIAAIGLEKVIKVSAKPLKALVKPTHKALGDGLLICNPPYGERWGEVDELRPLYQELGEVARREFTGWRLAVFTGNPDLGQELRLRSSKKYKFFNGTIAAQLLLFELREQKEGAERRAVERPLSEGARAFANRVEKNRRKLQPWLKRSGVTCYRLYDSDIPEYAVAVDIYGDAIHVQEYAPPATVDEAAARARLGEVRQALLSLFPGCREQLFFKERRRQKGLSQYQRQNTRPQGKPMVVSEGGVRLEVNLADYLDSGLFLDHRPIRLWIAERAAGKRFLNLFCYTAAATVHAAVGGASSSLSIDMSNTYLDWAGRNFALNDIDVWKHELLRADCLAWLAKREGSFDLIFLDPPTFSNSKKMEAVLDIQRDHPAVIRDAMAVLARGGTLVFSNNFRRFRMDEGIAAEFEVEDITARTIPPDFERNARIHNCWLLRHRD
ncbi:MAG: bifunctional 23S rRNA (guanine(2069)-N(7))-methyltransferase RlmK/23S rRNA (guanine(2445)-N(2))-methyltransferase RlmL [Bacteroidales bacterium]|nr:bifunctional 23S rRNA (guanine(2069)-N(7))-methyltransferase RlmK/23S rRNA (guanine(2445)-N(2))-methyltransferase RlmL [Bacteroidales bacterium]